MNHSKRNKYFLFLLLIACVLWTSCRKDFNYETSTGNLSFSKDTVYLDTVFTTIGSSTYSLKVYNNNDTDIQIPSITLKNGLSSKYQINVDGQAGKEFFNTPLLAKDSLYIFIETNFDINTVSETEFLYTDAIEFNHTNNTQSVSLVTLIKDATFLYPKKSSTGFAEQITINQNKNGEEIETAGFILNDSLLNFTNKKPYVIYGYAAIPENNTLNIDAGARVYFHQNSGIYVQKNSSLNVNGELSTDQNNLENEIIFEGDRLESSYDNVAGQWGGIIINKESNSNYINHLTLKNAITGIFINGNTNLNSESNLIIKNTQVYNSSNINIWCNSSKVIGENLVIGNAGNTSLYLNGGNYKFTHCTFSNYWNSSFRLGKTLHVNNTNEQILVNADFLNCIIDGNTSSEVLLSNSSSTSLLNFNFENCILKELSTAYNYNDTNLFNSIFINENASFINPNGNNFKLQEDSFAINKANISGSQTVPFDILGNSRNKENNDIGAYQFISNFKVKNN